jgi:hypothetical protein
MKRTFLTVLFNLVFSSIIFSQTGKISGHVANGNNESVKDYHVVILNTSDSSFVSGTSFAVENFSIPKPAGKYLAKITGIGYEDVIIEIPDISGDIQLGKIVLSPKVYSLDEVVVHGKSPFMTMKDDKFIYNVENSTISNSGTAIDMLKRVPYVIADPNGLISVAGRDNALILINGKQIRGNEELQLLNSSRVRQIEIITNPSAKYEAEGHAVINIITKKSLGEGLRSSLYTDYRQGRRGSIYFSPELSYEFDKFRLYTSLGGERYNSKAFTDTWIKYEKENYLFEHYTYALTLMEIWNFEYNAGIDYSIDKKNSVNIYFDGYLTDRSRNDLQDMHINKNGVQFPVMKSDGLEKTYPEQSSFGVNYDYKNEKGTEISFMNNYTGYSTLTRSTITETNQNTLSTNEMRSVFDNDYSLFASKLDISIPASKAGGQIEFGGKYSWIKNNNLIDFERYLSGNWVIDPTYSNTVDFTETILAGYALFSGKVKNWRYSAGVRAENVWTDNKSPEESLSLNDFQIFPNLRIGYIHNDKVNYQLTYSRRITRPMYEALNNSVMYIDSLAMKRGNPYLNPTIYNTVSASISWNRKINADVSYSYIESPVDMLFINDKEEIERYTTIYMNVKNTSSISLNLSGNFHYKAWSTQPFASYVYRPVSIVDDNETYSFKHHGWMVRCINQIALPKKWNIDLNFLFRQPTHSFKTFGKVINFDIGFSKTMFDNRLTLQANCHHDFKLWTQKHQYSYKYMYLEWDSNSRSFFNLSIRYTLGGKAISIQERKSNSDESKRM